MTTLHAFRGICTKSALLRKMHKVKNIIDHFAFFLFYCFVTYNVKYAPLFLNSLKSVVISQQAPISWSFWPTTETREEHQTQRSTMKSNLCLQTLRTLNSSSMSLNQSRLKDVWIMRQGILRNVTGVVYAACFFWTLTSYIKKENLTCVSKNHLQGEFIKESNLASIHISVTLDLLQNLLHIFAGCTWNETTFRTILVCKMIELLYRKWMQDTLKKNWFHVLV